MLLRDFFSYGIDGNLKIDFQLILIRGRNLVGRKLINSRLRTLNCPARPLFIIKTDTFMKNKGQTYEYDLLGHPLMFNGSKCTIGSILSI